MINLAVAGIALFTGSNLPIQAQLDESKLARELLATFTTQASQNNKYQKAVSEAILRIRREAAARPVSVDPTPPKAVKPGTRNPRERPYFSPEERAKWAKQSKIDAESDERYSSTLRSHNLEETKNVILQELNSKSISIGTRGIHLTNLALIDMRLGNLSESSKEMAAALPISPNYLAPDDGAALLYYTIIQGQRGIFYPGQEDYVNLKFKNVHENYFEKSICGDPSYRRYFNIPDRHRSILFKSYLLLADGVGGNSTIQIEAYCAEKAVELEPNNAAALLAYGFTHGRGVPLVVKPLLAIDEQLPAGDFKDYFDEYLSPGSTANRTKSRRHDTP